MLDADIIDALDEDELSAWFGRLLVSTPEGTMVAETTESRVVGFIRFGRDPEEEQNGHIEAFYVHPDASRRGLGRRIFEHALARLAADGMPTVTLWVFEANARTRAFYTAAGFVPDGTRRMEATYRAPIIRLQGRAAARTPSGGRRRGRPRHASADEASAVVLEVAPRASAALRLAAESLSGALTRWLDSGFPPGASLRVVDGRGELARVTGGAACVVDGRIDTTPDTLYDLASLTKVVATVTLSLVLAERGDWNLDDPAARWLPGFPRRDISLRQLLTHSSGLVPHREFFRAGRGVSVIRPLVYAEAVDAVPGPVSYSDLNYMLLGWALTRCTGTPLDRLFRELVAAPLGMERTSYRPPRGEKHRIAATELDGDQRLAPGLIWGEVHDGNAWALGGVSGHAGLFAPADDLGRFARALLTPERHPVHAADSITEMARRQAGAPPDVRALGWRLDASEWGAWPASTYWHTGFTGTSLLVAPERGVAVVLLMGGVHPKRDLDRQAAVRAELHRILAAALR